MPPIQGFICWKHGFGKSCCCDLATEIAENPVTKFFREYMQRTFPVYLPVNWEDCLQAMITHSYLPAVVFVGESEGHDDLVLDSTRWFEDLDVARQFLSPLVDSRLRFFAQSIRGRTNLLKILGKPLVRSARIELLREFPKTGGWLAAAGCCLDYGVQISEIQYNGTHGY